MFGNFLALWEIRAVALLAASACAAFYFFRLINSWVALPLTLWKDTSSAAWLWLSCLTSARKTRGQIEE